MASLDELERRGQLLSCEEHKKNDSLPLITLKVLYYCEQCETHQCPDCNREIHSKLKGHNFTEVQLHLEDAIQSKVDPLGCELWCDGKNLAEIWCEGCNGIRMCTLCDARLHNSNTNNRESHARRSLYDTDISIRDVSAAFLLMDEDEIIQVETAADFRKLLGTDVTEYTTLKVVSIFGNTGDGKSHTLNHAFFNGQEVFNVSAKQVSCTIGVWAKFHPKLNALFIDTEGLLGESDNANRRTRLLLKILAVSDIVVYRSRAERLHTDMFNFLGDAAKAYTEYFTQELSKAAERCNLKISLSNLGPALLIFHETQHTDPLGSSTPSPPDNKNESKIDKDRADKALSNISPEELIRRKFHSLKYSPNAFSSTNYVGIRTKFPPTNFTSFVRKIKDILSNHTVRAPRAPEVFLQALTVLNKKFSGDIDPSLPSSFPDQYFTCNTRCLACGARCEKGTNHHLEKIPHLTRQRCKYTHQFDNKVFTCIICFENGNECIVIPQTAASNTSAWSGLAQYMWAGYVLECKKCGVIYKSRQYWYGNREPTEKAARTEIRHVWEGDVGIGGNTSHNIGRRLMDGVSNISQQVSTSSSTATMTSWLTDQMAPSYWVANKETDTCHDCDKHFLPGETKHHCRACGNIFCEDCSDQLMPVPELGWGTIPVRVCRKCYTTRETAQTKPEININDSDDDDFALIEHPPVEVPNIPNSPGNPNTVTARKVGEGLQTVFSFVSSAAGIPKSFITDMARPSYWVPDADINECYLCREYFTADKYKHHCRACGQGFCGKCSSHQKSVPNRGWEYPVRVCDSCADKL
ncbi:hypothetical protein LOD99_13819 [Oopsacas minuta]|uniref:Zinc finger FYVE domain-containing protein 1 n=1 Tax=Oopsacas minuta TaxID=111878 RepID=A0AAV7KIC4_9METZ|nr:hypothetical protein LOD99_13819 [Oopsacas minuta]